MIDDLPVEILSMIFNELDWVYHMPVRSVCRKWKALIPRLENIDYIYEAIGGRAEDCVLEWAVRAGFPVTKEVVKMSFLYDIFHLREAILDVVYMGTEEFYNIWPIQLLDYINLPIKKMIKRFVLRYDVEMLELFRSEYTMYYAIKFNSQQLLETLVLKKFPIDLVMAAIAERYNVSKAPLIQLVANYYDYEVCTMAKNGFERAIELGNYEFLSVYCDLGLNRFADLQCDWETWKCTIKNNYIAKLIEMSKEGKLPRKSIDYAKIHAKPFTVKWLQKHFDQKDMP